MSSMATCVAVFVLAATPATVVAGAPLPQAEIKSIRGFETLQTWSRLVWEHKPGELDSPVRAISAWPESDLAKVRLDIWAIATIVSRGPEPRAQIAYWDVGQEASPLEMGPGRRPRLIRMADVPDLLSLPGERDRDRVDEAGITRFMKRAAMFHTDVVMLSAPTAGLPKSRSGLGQAAPAGRILDGEVTGWDPGPIHWEFGRVALAGVRPHLQSDQLVAAWYRATSAHMLSRREYGYLVPHLAQGRAILPADAHLQFYDGVLHEAYASSAVQAALQALRSGGGRPAVRSPVDELELAEGFFRRAIDLDPGFDLARVHLGRVVGLLGRHEPAVGELRRALSSLTDARQRYYAELFLAVEEQAVGRPAEATAAVNRASGLFPNAQAPYLALGQLAWQAADRAGAQVAFEKLAALPKALADREDPWWAYPVSTVLDSATLIEKMRRLAEEHIRK